MQKDKCTCPPGAHLVYKYMPNATDAERVEARRRLYEFVRVMLRIAVRLELEKRQMTKVRIN